jgi:folate-binding protein YgfZ
MSLLEDYQVIHEGTAIGAVSARTPLAVTGTDRAAYLQGLLTNDIVSLAPGTGCYAAWLTPQGRMLTDLHVLESGSMILLDVPVETAAATIERLEQFIFSEDVAVAPLADSLAAVWLHGPRAADVLQGVLPDRVDLSGWRDYQHAQVDIEGHPASLARIDQIGVPGFCVYVERSREAPMLALLQARGARVVAAAALEAARIEAAYPVYGVDMNETTIPLEAGIEQRAISFTKGCYVGQEIVIRVLHRGGGRVAKKLVAMRVDGAPPERGAALFSGAKEIGHVTSAAHSPALGSIALGYVHRDFVAPGTAIEVALGDGRSRAVVGERPLQS